MEFVYRRDVYKGFQFFTILKVPTDLYICTMQSLEFYAVYHWSVLEMTICELSDHCHTNRTFEVVTHKFTNQIKIEYHYTLIYKNFGTIPNQWIKWSKN